MSCVDRQRLVIKNTSHLSIYVYNTMTVYMQNVADILDIQIDVHVNRMLFNTHTTMISIMT